MANRCASLDPTLAYLPTPAPTHAAASHYCSSRAAACENEALTSALRASMAPAYASSAASSFSYPATPSSSTTSSASELLSSGHDAPAPASRPAGILARALKGPKGGRVSKRKPRPSRRPQTTYITADPSNFRRMVQEITGLPVPCPSSSVPAASEAAAAPAYALPTLDTSAFLLDRATPAPEYKSSSGSPSAVAAAGVDDSSVLLEMEPMIDFPTLESWGIF